MMLSPSRSRETWIKFAQLNREWYRIMRTDEFMKIVGDNYTENIYERMQQARRAKYVLYYNRYIPPCESFTFQRGTVYFIRSKESINRLRYNSQYPIQRYRDHFNTKYVNLEDHRYPSILSLISRDNYEIAIIALIIIAAIITIILENN